MMLDDEQDEQQVFPHLEVPEYAQAAYKYDKDGSVLKNKPEVDEFAQKSNATAELAQKAEGPKIDYTQHVQTDLEKRVENSWDEQDDKEMEYMTKNSEMVTEWANNNANIKYHRETGAK